MKLDTFTIKNFRQYYGGSKEQKICFSKSADKNVTVIHGENGSGKTALLNAFSWLMYGKISKTFDPSGKIISERAMAEANVGDEVEVLCRLTFDHNNKRYTVQRSKKVIKRDHNDLDGEVSDENLYLDFIDVDGKNIKPKNPQDVLNQIMPFQLKDLFFFHGEYIDNLSREENAEEIQKAIRNIMGLTILERAIYHLGKVSKRFENQMEEHGGKELQELIERKREFENEVESKKEEIHINSENINSLDKQISEINKNLKSNKDAAEKQKRRERLENELIEKQKHLTEINENLKEEVSLKSFLSFSRDLPEKVNNIVAKKREKGQVPSAYKGEFIEDLIDKGTCICGRSIEEGSREMELLRKWRDKATPEGLDEAVTTLSSQMRDLRHSEGDFIKKIKKMRQSGNRILEDIDGLNEKISAIGGEFKKEQADIRDLENKREKLYQKKGEYRSKSSIAEEDIQQLNKKIKDLEKDISEKEEIEASANLAKRRFIITYKTKEFLSQEFERFAKKVRDDVEEVVGEHYSNFINKPFWAEISDDYKLNIFKKVGDIKSKVHMSTGERQVASLSFIGGLAYIAKKQFKERRDAKYFKGGIYPIVMDAPFGYLDTEYRKQIANGVPQLADQVVVFVTSSQWTGEIEDAMRKIAGKEYHLEYHSPEKEDVTYETTYVREVD